MRHSTTPTILAALLTLALAAPLGAAPPVVDGTLDAVYGAAQEVQTIQTQFGNATDGNPGYCNGSELDAFYAIGEGGWLYVFIAGNLESNYNKLEVFVDSKPGGQNVLRNDNPNVDFNGLNRMAGLTFDAGMEPDFWLGVTGGDAGGTYKIFCNTAELLADGGGEGNYAGEGGARTDGTLSGGTNPSGLRVTIDNSNTAGVDGGCAAAAGGASVTTGLEIAVPLDALEYAGGPIKVTVFVNGGGHDYVSNQVLGGLPDGTCNLGEPANVNFAALSGDQFVELQQQTPARHRSWGQVKIRYR